MPISVIQTEFEALRGLYGLRDSKIVTMPQSEDLSEYDVNLGQFTLIRDRVLSKNPSAIASVLPIPSNHTIGESFIYGGDTLNLREATQQLLQDADKDALHNMVATV